MRLGSKLTCSGKLFASGEEYEKGKVRILMFYPYRQIGPGANVLSIRVSPGTR